MAKMKLIVMTKPTFFVEEDKMGIDELKALIEQIENQRK